MQDHRDVSSSAIYQRSLTLTIKKITVQEKIRRRQGQETFKYFESQKAPDECYGFEWKECEDSSLDILEESNCPIIEEVPIESNPISIELDDSLLDRYNEFSEEELEDWFGTFVPVQSLNPYMTKVSMCSIEKVRLE